VIYGVTEETRFDPKSRVNTFLHVNHSDVLQRLGVLLCINGTGILNSWLKHNTGNNLDYDEMNELAGKADPGSDGLTILPFGNGSERMLANRNIGARIKGLNFNTHTRAHLFRAAQEGIVFSFRYGLDIMKETGINPKVIRAGNANMFRSPLFREALSCITGVEIHLYNTDGSIGAARGAGIGCGYYKSGEEAFAGLKEVEITNPDKTKTASYESAYSAWKEYLFSI
jgi:xylulokinase